MAFAAFCSSEVSAACGGLWASLERAAADSASPETRTVCGGNERYDIDLRMRSRENALGLSKQPMSREALSPPVWLCPDSQRDPIARLSSSSPPPCCVIHCRHGAPNFTRAFRVADSATVVIATGAAKLQRRDGDICVHDSAADSCCLFLVC